MVAYPRSALYNVVSTFVDTRGVFDEWEVVMYQEFFFWVMTVAFVGMIVIRWVEAFQAERFPVGKIVAVTVTIVLTLGATFILRCFYLPSGVWGSSIALMLTLLNLVFLIVAFFVFTKTAPDRPTAPARERRLL